jgi:hypothetical protein
VTSVATTLFDSGPYELGAAALINSLVASGFTGSIWCGVRGSEPTWLTPETVGALRARSIDLKVMPLTTPYQLANYKPHFLLEVAGREAPGSVITYFDPDVVVKCKWSFVAQWCSTGIAAVGDENWLMPRSSPVRAELHRLRLRLEVPARPGESPEPLDMFCNSGFVGVPGDRLEFLELWRDLADAFVTRERSGIASHLSFPETWPDQALFNIALMGYGGDLSLMGPSAMDFAPGGQVLSHATGPLKPWSRSFIRSALAGKAPKKSDGFYLEYARGPVGPMPLAAYRRKRLAYRVARWIGMFMRRTDY